MTAETAAAAEPGDRYTPEAYIMHLADVLFWQRGLSAEDIRGNKARVVGAVERAMRAVLGEVVDLVAADRDIPWPEGLAPYEYMGSLAKRLAGPIWPRYTAGQRGRMLRFAARYMLDQITTFFGPDQLQATPAVPPEVREDLPYEVRALLMQRFFHLSEYRKSLTMVTAYVQTHPADEIVGDDLHELMSMVWAPPDQRPFF